MRGILKLAFGPVFALPLSALPAAAQNYSGSGGVPGLAGIFDEVRLGTVFSVQDNDDSGVIVSGQLYFRSFMPPDAPYFVKAILGPRVHVGGNVATAEEGVSQVYAGLTWEFPVTDLFFLEASFGGTWHNGPLESSTGGLALGCEVLFRESAGVGVNIGERWRVVASADHSSHADFCDQGKASNSGITHAGVYAGFRF
jgi:hypothetical protein